jgi:glucose/arabinose dehydrogenase
MICRGACWIVGAIAAVAWMSAYAADVPGQSFSISADQLPKPYATPAVDDTSKKIARPPGARPQVPQGFTVSVFARGLKDARWMTVAPNGDVLLSEPDLGRVMVLRPSADGAQASRVSVFARGFDRPHGLAIHDGALYVADVNAVWRLPYATGQLKTSAKPRHVFDTTPKQPTGHFTRDIVFDSKGDLFLAIGSMENTGEDPLPRASVQEIFPNGTHTIFASGLRNPIGMAFYPGSGDLYVTVNERDGLGDFLPPDYLTRIRQGDFYGWPYAYAGPHPDPDYGAKHPDLVATSKVPDVLFQAHSAPLGLVFYDGRQFPPDYRDNAFVALHGSWNSSHPTGYKVVRVKFQNGRPQNTYENFLTGFWDGATSPAQAWGRPVGLAVARDGSLLVADDTGGVVWRVAYSGK